MHSVQVCHAGRGNPEPPSALRLLRVSAGLKQAELAELAEVSRDTIYRLEVGKQLRPQRRVGARIAAALGVEPEVLFK